MCQDPNAYPFLTVGGRFLNPAAIRTAERLKGKTLRLKVTYRDLGTPPEVFKGDEADALIRALEYLSVVAESMPEPDRPRDPRDDF